MLFEVSDGGERVVPLGDGAVLLGGLARTVSRQLMAAIEAVAAIAPFRRMITPGGRRMSVAMTNCGRFGWTSDAGGYRYSREDPITGSPWSAMPRCLDHLAGRAAGIAGYSSFRADACLVNEYAPGARLTLHQDRNERSLEHPIVSVSLGLPAIFLWGGGRRGDKPRRIPLFHGDVVVWGGPTRLAFHGIDALADGSHALTGRRRYNLTFRKAG